MEKLYTSKTFSKWLVGECMPLILAPGHKLQKQSKESGLFQSLGTINFFFLLKGGVKRGGGKAQCPSTPKYALVSTFRQIKVLIVNFQKKGLDKKVFVVRDEALYFSEALGFSLPSLLVNPALPSLIKRTRCFRHCLNCYQVCFNCLLNASFMCCVILQSIALFLFQSYAMC